MCWKLWTILSGEYAERKIPTQSGAGGQEGRHVKLQFAPITPVRLDPHPSRAGSGADPS